MDFTTGSRDMDFNDVSYGISSAGFEGYLEYLKLNVLKKLKDELNETQDVKNSINSGWQGVSRDRFLEKFDKTISSTCGELEGEFNHLRNRLMELARSYYEQDSKMMDEI